MRYIDWLLFYFFTCQWWGMVVGLFCSACLSGVVVFRFIDWEKEASKAKSRLGAVEDRE
jgi:hypothetical protein